MGGIYKITAGQWDANGELVEDDTDYYAQQELPVINGKQGQACDTIEIPVVEVGGQIPLPPPGTMVYLLGIPGMPDGIYTIGNDDDDSSGQEE